MCERFEITFEHLLYVALNRENLSIMEMNELLSHIQSTIFYEMMIGFSFESIPWCWIMNFFLFLFSQDHLKRNEFYTQKSRGKKNVDKHKKKAVFFPDFNSMRKKIFSSWNFRSKSNRFDIDKML